MYVEGQWRALDATAASSLPMPSETPALGALWDTLRSLSTRGLAALSRREWWAVASVLALLFLIWGILRWRRSLGEQKSDGSSGYSDSLESFKRLSRRLARRGIVRQRQESLVDFVERMRSFYGAQSPVVDAIQNYIAFRYGRIGTPETVDERLRHAEQWLKREGRRYPRT